MIRLLLSLKEKIFNMKTTDEKKVVEFLGNEYDIEALGRAVGSSVDVYIKPDDQIHEIIFDQEKMPVKWKKDFKRPIMTVHTGKYVFIYKPDSLVMEKGFKARLISKYLFNKCKHKEFEYEIETPQSRYPESFSNRSTFKPRNSYNGEKRSFDKPYGYKRNDERSTIKSSRTF